ncbi:pyruvate:ferredoxin (flavodoxin) oxidoreductase [Candidatus Woesearchaeota archaeon]|nr:pyruvate:ferredoxin (flavodoxin) oxidoreductase [Candidatus Woesearchaeota archaeon]
MKKEFITCDGNTAAASVAYAFSEVAAIYPITPSSPMGELADAMAAKGKKNLFGQVVKVAEMQSEGGASGAIHGSLTGGALTTTFTASQGLLLMIPNMFKIAGELLPTVFHVSARSLACQSLSIFGDHSDVMAARGTGFAMLASASVQEAQDMALVAHLSTLESRIPFVHFFDGFRTSHEVQKIELIEHDTMKHMLNPKFIRDFRYNALNPERPTVKVGAENPDVYFQGREVSNKFYTAVPGIVEKYFKLLAEKTGREYSLFDYVGSKDAEKIIISMCSSTETIEETVNYLTSKGEKVGAIKVRLFRPLSAKHLLDAIPKTVKKIAVLDRTKEPGSEGEPLYLDVLAALKGGNFTIIGGRYGLSSKEFTPGMVIATYNHLDGKCTHGFTVGITDDVTNTSLEVKDEPDVEQKGIARCKFWGYGSDGTVGANKTAIKIIGDNTGKYVQGYFDYDSKKSGGTTVSHLRFGDKKIQSQYLLTKADFIALHKTSYIGRYDILEGISKNGTFLLNCPWSAEDAFCHLTESMQKTILDKKVKFYVIDALKIAKEAGLGNRINTVMQVAFFKISGIIPEEKAIELIKKGIEKEFARKGEQVVQMNMVCVDKAGVALAQAKIPSKQDIRCVAEQLLLPKDASQFAKDVIEPIMKLKGNEIPVSRMTLTGAVPSGTTRLEKRGVADEVPRWLPEKCIQCGQCTFVCPHASIRMKQISNESLKDAPATFATLKSNTKNDRDLKFRIQVYPEDCQGCTLCVQECPVKALEMIPLEESRKSGERANEEFFEQLPDNVVDGAPETTIKGTQLKTPLFEFSGACAGCGETPYIKLATQLFGDRMIIANATGCSSIYGGTFPTIPYCKNKEGKGPAWANSLFEDNAEYGFGMRLAIDANRSQLLANINHLLEKGTTPGLTEALKKCIELWDRTDDEAKAAARTAVGLLPGAIDATHHEAKAILEKIDELKDYFVEKSVWIFGGDGWAYDIGYGGLDHVLAQGLNVNVLVLDTEVYSNTGGQSSKSTPIGAIAKFAASGKRTAKKNLGLMMMTYGNVYVASVNMGANKMQLIKAMLEAERYNGPSILIAYAPCINHGISMAKSQLEEKRAAEAGYWPVYRYNPELVKEGKNPLVWDSKEAKLSFKEFLMGENRYRALAGQNPDVAEKLFALAEEDAKRRFKDIQGLTK